MRFLIKKYTVVLLSLFILVQLIPSVKIAGGWDKFFWASLTFSLIYYLGRPIVNIISFPVNLLTLNLFSWIIIILSFYLWVLLTKEVGINHWNFTGLRFGSVTLSAFEFNRWQVIIISGIILSLLIRFISWLID